MNNLGFIVAGTPIPQGSHKAFYNKKKGYAYVVPDTKGGTLDDWRQAIAYTAREAMQKQGFPFIDGKHDAVAVFLSFEFLRPPSVSKQRKYPCVKPDPDKLARSALDALSGIVYRDDAQVTSLTITKRYAPEGKGPSLYVAVSRE